MNEHDRDLAQAIYQGITHLAAIQGALDTWRATNAADMHYRMWVAISTNAAHAIDDVLASRQREAARTGPWDGPSAVTREEMLFALRERVAHLEIRRGRGRITARIHELECMRAALRELEAARTCLRPKATRTGPRGGP